MSNAAQIDLKNTQAFIARFREIHDVQAQSAREELGRLRSLINDAGERLMSSFNVIAEISVRRDAIPSGEITEAVDNAMSALQFQDMAGQLVGHAVRRIELLERITEPLARFPESSVEELNNVVEGTVYDRDTGPVEQACMSGGSVDLF